MSAIWTIFIWFDWISFVLIGLSVLYIACFSLASCKKNHLSYAKTNRKNRFLIIIPAYAEDKVIIESVQRLQDIMYPKHLFHTVVVSDHHTAETNHLLDQFPIEKAIAT